MSTPLQNAASIANSLHSTGPRTDAGKAASALNSIKHGLTGRHALLPGEDPVTYIDHCDGFVGALEPFNTPEETLVQELADIQWRLNRVPGLEAAILSQPVLDFKALNNIALYAGRLKRQYSASLKDFQVLRAQRIVEQKDSREKAIAIRRADLINNLPERNFYKLGFVFSGPEIDELIKEDELLEFSKKTVQDHCNSRTM